MVLPAAASDLAPRTPVQQDEVRNRLHKRCSQTALAHVPVAPIARARVGAAIAKPAQVASAINANKNAG